MVLGIFNFFHSRLVSQYLLFQKVVIKKRKIHSFKERNHETNQKLYKKKKMLCFTTVALVCVSQLHDNTAAATASSPAQPASGPQSGQSPTPASLSPSNQLSPVSQTHTLPDRSRRCETSQAALILHPHRHD